MTTTTDPAELVREWQEENHEWFKRDIAEIVEDFAKWLLARPPSPRGSDEEVERVEPSWRSADTYELGQVIFNHLHGFLNAAGIKGTDCKLTITVPTDEDRKTLTKRLQSDMGERGPPRSAGRHGNSAGTWQGIAYEFAALNQPITAMNPSRVGQLEAALEDRETQLGWKIPAWSMRQARSDLHTPIDKVFADANRDIESWGCHPDLTSAQNLVGSAWNFINHWIGAGAPGASDSARAALEAHQPSREGSE